jgi:formylglycine-generating enzyme required for sulfatase activity
LKCVAALFACALASAPLDAAEVNAQDMIVIPAGAFTMGSDDGPADEKPAHKVELAAFAIDRLPVTNTQFAEFLNAIGTHNKAGERMYDFDDSDARRAGSRVPGGRECVWRARHGGQYMGMGVERLSSLSL